MPIFSWHRVYLDSHRDLIICCVREFYVLAEPVDNIGHDIPFYDEFHSYAFGLVEQYTFTRQIMGITLAYIYALQRITSCKDIISNVYYTVWYCYVFQGCASRKSLIPDDYHTVRNCYAFQCVTTPKSIFFRYLLHRRELLQSHFLLLPTFCTLSEHRRKFQNAEYTYNQLIK